MNMLVLVMAQLLKNSRPVLYAGYLAFSASVSVYIFLSSNILSCFLLTLGSIFGLLLHQYIALRVQFDADLLQLFIDHPERTTTELDESLLQFKLMPISKIQRSWELRTQGCLKLFKLQFLILFLQYLILFSMIFITFYGGSSAL